MGLLTHSKIDRDFEGGIYLNPLGALPPLDRVTTVSLSQTTPAPSPSVTEEFAQPVTLCNERVLSVPLQVPPDIALEVSVQKGQFVKKNTLLARHEKGYYYYAPLPGIVRGTSTAWVDGRSAQPVLDISVETEEPLTGEEPPEQTIPYPDWIPVSPAEIAGSDARKIAVLHAIERAGIIDPDSRLPLARRLQQLLSRKIKTVIANATPLEPDLNTPLAILHLWPEQVFAGLAILKQWLGASEAVMAYPHHFSINRAPAAKWQVRCLPVSEKYPQARPASILRTLQKRRTLSRFRQPGKRAAVFDIQLLRQVERTVLAAALPTERIITVSGDGVARPGHFQVPLGLRLRRLLELASKYDDADCVVEGASLAGKAINPDQTIISSTSQYFTVIRRLSRPSPQPCIRCGWCLDDCPAGIDPARLEQWYQQKQFTKALSSGLHACIDCGICSYICPSHLPIMEHIRTMKREMP